MFYNLLPGSAHLVVFHLIASTPVKYGAGEYLYDTQYECRATFPSIYTCLISISTNCKGSSGITIR
ncbi:MAG: hypothetical protein KatS3mg031_3065 [Chitinophagales bacterium]|nr:MAG: hypothetical protein KatS3mg031_3065 [Chitinophagales bacterium]